MAFGLRRTVIFWMMLALPASMGSDTPHQSPDFFPLRIGDVHEISGWMASALVLATFAMQSMRPLRITAIASNVAFISYAFLENLHPILVLHSILLPLNILRLTQIDTPEADKNEFPEQSSSADRAADSESSRSPAHATPPPVFLARLFWTKG